MHIIKTYCLLIMTNVADFIDLITTKFNFISSGENSTHFISFQILLWSLLTSDNKAPKIPSKVYSYINKIINFANCICYPYDRNLFGG